MRILVDLDDVCADLRGKWLRTWNEEEGDSLTVDQITDWSTVAWPLLGQRFNPETVRRCKSILRRPGFFDGLEPLAGAAEGVRALVDMGHEVLICTAPAGPDSARAKIEWCDRELGLPERDVAIFQHKDWLTFDIMIDDGPQNFHWLEDEAAARCREEILGYRSRRRRRSVVFGYPFNGHLRRFADLYNKHAHRDPAGAWDRTVEYVRRLTR